MAGLSEDFTLRNLLEKGTGFHQKWPKFRKVNFTIQTTYGSLTRGRKLSGGAGYGPIF